MKSLTIFNFLCDHSHWQWPIGNFLFGIFSCHFERMTSIFLHLVKNFDLLLCCVRCSTVRENLFRVKVLCRDRGIAIKMLIHIIYVRFVVGFSLSLSLFFFISSWEFVCLNCQLDGDRFRLMSSNMFIIFNDEEEEEKSAYDCAPESKLNSSSIFIICFASRSLVHLPAPTHLSNALSASRWDS